MSGWRAALRISRREARWAKGRSVLVIALIALPVAGLAFFAVTGFTGVRITPPFDVMANNSSSGLMTTAPTKPPRRDVILAVKTPLPPRPWIGYSSIGVRFA